MDRRIEIADKYSLDPKFSKLLKYHYFYQIVETFTMISILLTLLFGIITTVMDPGIIDPTSLEVQSRT